MRVLVTGGFGFVGGRIAQHLLEAGHQVVLGTRQASGSPAWLPSAEVVPTNWHDIRALAQICSGVDVVVQAAGVNAQECSSDPVAALEFNGLATARLVAAASSVGVRRFIYLSTAHVYTSPLTGKITEDTCPRNLHPYATSHLAGENSVLSASQRREIEGIVLRLSNAFGAPMHSDANCWFLLVNDLCRQAILTGKLLLRTDGLQQRDFITLQDVARCVRHFVESLQVNYSPGLLNLGGNRTHSIYEIAQLVAERCQKVLNFTPAISRAEPPLAVNTAPLEYSIDKLMATGFKLENQFEDAIDSTLLLCKKIL